ncbi:phosphoribosyl-AMP cyclohydrolase [Pseudobythopirellula maris]|uniref:Phosphoribosyl-AMP cyclohydrolase n=1 Tax=Pseudobythopirellula maris TaxID=2527991 RepID=A0A5C5ZMQ6_9BACT|nr:phosphoribosyl-AMP cyclohydrolase [Pseudobythopirellula maris]TWT88752.1 phosphoribosyl-AMP cyclohydrolase [Pseudobythopirellula maris]
MASDPDQIPAFSSDDTLLPAIVQSADSGKVLMLAYMNREAYEETLRTGATVFYSRSRNSLWRKGETSGHVQHVRQLLVDCDGDTILVKVDQVGPGACHVGYPTCFYREVTPDGLRVVEEMAYDAKKTYGGE